MPRTENHTVRRLGLTIDKLKRCLVHINYNLNFSLGKKRTNISETGIINLCSATKQRISAKIFVTQFQLFTVSCNSALLIIVYYTCTSPTPCNQHMDNNWLLEHRTTAHSDVIQFYFYDNIYSSNECPSDIRKIQVVCS